MPHLKKYVYLSVDPWVASTFWLLRILLWTWMDSYLFKTCLSILSGICPEVEFFFFFALFLGPHSRHVEVPRLGVESELQLLAYTTATATWDPSHVCNLDHSSWQCQTLNQLSEAITSWFLVGFVSAAPQRELPEVEFLDHMVIFNLGGTTILFPTNSAPEFKFSTSWPMLLFSVSLIVAPKCYFIFFNDFYFFPL